MRDHYSLKKRLLESSFQRKVTAKLKTLRNAWFFKASDRLRSGIPDIICSINGKFVAMELKRDRKAKPSKIQNHTLEKISESKGEAFVVHPENWDEIWEKLVALAGDIR